MGDLGLIPRTGRSVGRGHGNQLQYSCLENPHGRRNLVGYSPWGRKELDMTEQLSTAYIPSPVDLPDPGTESGSPTLQQILYQLRYQGGLYIYIIIAEGSSHFPVSVWLLTYWPFLFLLSIQEQNHLRNSVLDQYMSPHSCIHLWRCLGALRNSWRKQKDSPQNERKYLQKKQWARDWSPKYTNSSWSSISKTNKQTNQKMSKRSK